MKYEEAKEIVSRFGHKQARLILAGQKKFEAESEEKRLQTEIDQMKTHVLTAIKVMVEEELTQ